MNAQTSNSPNTIVIKERRSRLFCSIGWIGFLVCLAILIVQQNVRRAFDARGGVGERFVSGTEGAGNKIAVVHVSGVILGGRGFVKQQIDLIKKDASVKAIVLRIDSPGGTVSGSHFLYHHLSELRQERNIPLVVSMGSIAASGGYYIAMAAGKGDDLLFAEPTTTTGSIGVIIPHYNIADLMNRFGVQDDSIKSHPLKDMLSMTRKMTDQEREIAQEYVDLSFQRFKKVILESRPQLKGDEPDTVVDPNTKKDLATGQIFTAEQALASGLIDQIGYIEDAVARAREMAGLSESNSRVVEFQRPATLWSMVGVNGKRVNEFEHDPRPAAAYWKATAPQAFYLSTTVPPLLHTFGVAK